MPRMTPHIVTPILIVGLLLMPVLFFMHPKPKATIKPTKRHPLQIIEDVQITRFTPEGNVHETHACKTITQGAQSHQHPKWSCKDITSHVTQNKDHVTLKAGEAIYDPKEGLIHLNKAIDIEKKDAHGHKLNRLQTDALTINPDTQQAETKAEIRATQGRLLTSTSQGGKIAIKNKKVSIQLNNSNSDIAIAKKQK